MPATPKNLRPCRETLAALPAADVAADYATAHWIEGYRVGQLAVYVPTPKVRWSYVPRSELQGLRFTQRARKCCS